MANADTRLKRQSATCILVPSMASGVFPGTSGVVQAEKQAVSWAYSGILAVSLIPPVASGGSLIMYGNLGNDLFNGSIYA